MLRKVINLVFTAGIIILIGIYVIKLLFPMEYKDDILKYSKENGINPNLVCALIKTESNFNPDAVSSKGAIGLMQVTPDTAEWCADKMGIKNFNINQLYNHETNIRIGTWYYSYLTKQFKSEDLAIISYNGGINNVKKWLNQDVIDGNYLNVEDIPFKETKNYIKKVNKYKFVYEMLYKLTN